MIPICSIQRLLAGALQSNSRKIKQEKFVASRCVDVAIVSADQRHFCQCSGFESRCGHTMFIIVHRILLRRVSIPKNATLSSAYGAWSGPHKTLCTKIRLFRTLRGPHKL